VARVRSGARRDRLMRHQDDPEQIHHPDQRSAKKTSPAGGRKRSGFLGRIENRGADLLGAALTVWRWGRQNSANLEAGRRSAASRIGSNGVGTHSWRLAVAIPSTGSTRSRAMIPSVAGSLRCSKPGTRTMASVRSRRRTWLSRCVRSSIRRDVVASLSQRDSSNSWARAQAVCRRAETSLLSEENPTLAAMASTLA